MVRWHSISENIIDSRLTDLENGHIGLTCGSEKQLGGPGLSAGFMNSLCTWWCCLSETDPSGVGSLPGWQINGMILLLLGYFSRFFFSK